MKKIDLQTPDRIKSPFKVPEGYFQQFADDLMEQLPVLQETPAQEVSHKGIVKRLRPLFYAAAMVCGILLSVQTYYHINQPTLQESEAMAEREELTASEVSYQKVDEFCDYARVDHEDVYDYVTGQSN